jgi:hypothetical protein
MEVTRGELQPTREFLRATGAAGVIAGVVTLSIVILPWIYGEPGSFDDQLALHSNPLYLIDQWLRYLNIFAILTVSLGLAAHRLRASPGAAATGMLFMLFYGAAELLGRSVMIFVREFRWVDALVEADDQSRVELMMLVEGFDAVWSGWFMLILMTFSLAALLLGWAVRGGSKLQQATSWLLLASAGLGVVTFGAVYISQLRTIASWAYVIVQPISRLVMGAVLWSESRVRIGQRADEAA